MNILVIASPAVTNLIADALKKDEYYASATIDTYQRTTMIGALVLQRRNYELLVVDGSLRDPGLSPIDFLRKATEICIAESLKTKMIFLLDSFTDPEPARARAAGADALCSCQFSSANLITAIDQALHGTMLARSRPLQG